MIVLLLNPIVAPSFKRINCIGHAPRHGQIRNPSPHRAKSPAHKHNVPQPTLVESFIFTGRVVKSCNAGQKGLKRPQAHRPRKGKGAPNKIYVLRDIIAEGVGEDRGSGMAHDTNVLHRPKGRNECKVTLRNEEIPG